MTYQIQEHTVNVVGSSKFGVYPKISLEKTFNMFISDGWLINYPGYKRVNSSIDGDEGRGQFHSIRGNFLLTVIDDKVYKVNTGGGASLVGRLNTRFGEVFIAENLTSQICIVDGNDAWIYYYGDGSFIQQTLTVATGDLVPGYVEYHNSFFLLAPSVNDPNNTNNWYAFQRATDTTISLVVGSTFPLQTKADKCVAIKRIPGKSDNVLVIGTAVCEIWSNVGGLQNYRRVSSVNIDSGCVQIGTIAANEKFICFLAQNEDNSPVIISIDGTNFDSISTDGINNLLANLVSPQTSTAFFFRVNGHLFYQITFYDSADNLSLIYDFKERKFYHVTDYKLDFHPARQATYFNSKIYFVGIKRGSLYELSTNYNGAFEEINTDSGEVIPRIRITDTFRLPTSEPFFINNFQFWMEQGVTNFPKLLAGSDTCFHDMITEDDGEQMLTEGGEIMLTEDGFCVTAIDRPRVDCQLSKLGNEVFSNVVGFNLNPEGEYQNRVTFNRLGYANEITFQLNFWGLNRFIVNNGTISFIRRGYGTS